jgi:hypothetical protein
VGLTDIPKRHFFFLVKEKVTDSENIIATLFIFWPPLPAKNCLWWVSNTVSKTLLRALLPAVLKAELGGATSIESF